eukprot:scaffold167339_cov54-Attheya_sp.AAC.1
MSPPSDPSAFPSPLSPSTNPSSSAFAAGGVVTAGAVDAAVPDPGGGTAGIAAGNAGAAPFAAGVVVTAGAVDADVPAPGGTAGVAVGTAGAAGAAGGFVAAVGQTHCRQRFMQPSDSGIFSDEKYSVWHA